MPLRLRAQRRAYSRDASRAFAAPNPSGGKNRATRRHHGWRGDISALVHGKHDTAWLYSDTVNSSGQQRINAKRTQRAEYWRTVRVRVSAEIEPYFRRSLHLMGARILGRTPHPTSFALDLDVHIPGAPVEAVAAEPVYRSERTDDGYRTVLDRITWFRGDGSRIEANQPIGAAR